MIVTFIKRAVRKEFSHFSILSIVNKMYGNALKVLIVHKYLILSYSGAIIMKCKLSGPDHVSAIKINLGKITILCQIFTFFIFFKKEITFVDQS